MWSPSCSSLRHTFPLQSSVLFCSLFLSLPFFLLKSRTISCAKEAGRDGPALRAASSAAFARTRKVDHLRRQFCYSWRGTSTGPPHTWKWITPGHDHGFKSVYAYWKQKTLPATYEGYVFFTSAWNKCLPHPWSTFISSEGNNDNKKSRKADNFCTLYSLLPSLACLLGSSFTLKSAVAGGAIPSW